MTPRPDETMAEQDASSDTRGSERIRRRRTSVLALATECEWHQTHSTQVAMLADALFEQLKGGPGYSFLPPESAELLHYAALLHDIGYIVGVKGHHKHSHRLIRDADLPGVLPHEQAIVALTARSHRKPFRGPGGSSFAGIGQRDSDIVMALAAVLRVADGLDRSQTCVVRDVEARFACGPASTTLGAGDRNTLGIGLTVAGDADAEIRAGERKADLLARVVAASVHITILHTERGTPRSGSA
jgi:exopolyphosphatase / guanosine-5'-triphosphate,3'-diphosphate pyrophosphatase